MFGRTGVLELMTIGVLVYTLMWNIPPVRAGLLSTGMSIALMRTF